MDSKCKICVKWLKNKELPSLEEALLLPSQAFISPCRF